MKPESDRGSEPPNCGVVVSDERVAIREEEREILRPGRSLLQLRRDVFEGAFGISLQGSAQEEAH